MENGRKPCGCFRDCPCYPRCDEMMEQLMPYRSEALNTPWHQARLQTDTEEAEEKDWMMMKEMFPETAKVIQSQVELACDKMEYEGSAMYDAVPDKTRIWNMTEEIMRTIGDRLASDQEEEADLYTMNREPCRNCRSNPDFLRDLIQVMLHQEMFHRRCRHRGCRRW